MSFGVRKGETKVIIGPSGTGKSTLLRCIKPAHPTGQGACISGSGSRINYFCQKIGMVFQNFYLFDHLTALRNVEIGLLKVKKMKPDVAREEARQVGMEEWADHYPAELSGGQAQRLSIARAPAMDPDVMMFDEPTSAPDPELTREVLDVIRELARQGITMLIVTHAMGFALSVATEVIFMEGGRIVERGSPHELLEGEEASRIQPFPGDGRYSPVER
ncbi:MAG: amino acid ABC transporter ATP-binding protein [Methanoculleaceae archaeon]